MKTNFTLGWLLFCCSLFTFAQDHGRLTIKSQNGEKFFVFINNQQLNNQPQSAVLIDNLDMEVYDLTVRLPGNNNRPLRIPHLSLLDSQGIFRHLTYQLQTDNRRNRLQLEFESMLPVNYRAIIPRQVFVAHYTPIASPEPPRSQHQQQYEPLPLGCTNAYPMKANDFADALATIKKQGFDDTRLKIANQIVSANCLTTDQIIGICKLFSFDDNKLNFAKFAYDFCVEPANYYKVNNVFSFSSSAEALSDYVTGKG